MKSCALRLINLNSQPKALLACTIHIDLTELRET